MIYITQMIYLVPGEEKAYEEFETIAIPIISKYNGKLLFRIRPEENTFIECQGEKPYEVHLAAFDSEQDFRNFSMDSERKKYLHLKEKAIRSSVLILGTKL